MFGRLAVLPRRAAGVRPAGVRLFSDARPMTRFDQYPFDKTKMDEVRMFCAAGFPGGWLSASQQPHRKSHPGPCSLAPGPRVGQRE